MTTYSTSVISNPTVRVVSILSLLTGASPRKIGLVEISDRLGIAKSTCCLVLAELCAAGYLIKDCSTQRYGLGLKTSMLVGQYAPSDNCQGVGWLKELHAQLGVPISVVQLSRRHAIVIRTIQPASDFARLEFRRPFTAPFGAGFLINSGESERDRWIESALQFEGKNVQLIRSSLVRRLERFQLLGYEVVHQSEQDILERWQGGRGIWNGDLFETDAATNAFRRRLLCPELLLSEKGRNSTLPASRIVVPFSVADYPVKTCLEFWLSGMELDEHAADCCACNSKTTRFPKTELNAGELFQSDRETADSTVALSPSTGLHPQDLLQAAARVTYQGLTEAEADRFSSQ